MRAEEFYNVAFMDLVKMRLSGVDFRVISTLLYMSNVSTGEVRKVKHRASAKPTYVPDGSITKDDSFVDIESYVGYYTRIPVDTVKKSIDRLVKKRLLVENKFKNYIFYEYKINTAILHYPKFNNCYSLSFNFEEDWFYEAYPSHCIDTDIIEQTEGEIGFRLKIL